MAKQATRKTAKEIARKTAGKTVRKSPQPGKAKPQVGESGPLEVPPLIVSISGIRGIAGLSLTPATIVPYIEAFANLFDRHRVVIGHDARPSSKWIIPIVEGALRSHGIDVVNIGLTPTPTIGVLIRRMKASGGIAVTASHNPIQYNGLKFFHPGGEFLTAEMLEKLLALVRKPSPLDRIPPIGKLQDFPDGVEFHLRALLHALPPPERQRASKAPKVIIDTCNSAGAVLAPDVADAYGAVFQLINSDTRSFSFPREAEPTPENISQLCRAVVKEGADLGFAIDPDADRLALVDEHGVAIGEERTLVLAADAYLGMARRKSPIVVNLATSRAIDDVAARHKVSVYRTAIGEANVMAGLRKYKSRIGGEGNGGVIFPQVQPGRDAAVAIALILIGLQARGGTLSDWNASIPDYVMRKHKIPLNNLSVVTALNKVKKAFRGEKIDTTDGVKVVMRDRWLQIRPSNTEPIVRVFTEAPDESGADELLERVIKILA